MSNIKHGCSGTSEYGSWEAMIQRCRNPNDKRYKDYGGRGISICARWLDFRNFLADMGKRPKGLTLERINNDGNYTPKNCTWATLKEQQHNTRRQKPFLALGPHSQIETPRCQLSFAKKWGLSPFCINKCLRGKRIHHRNWKFEYLSLGSCATHRKLPR